MLPMSHFCNNIVQQEVPNDLMNSPVLVITEARHLARNFILSNPLPPPPHCSRPWIQQTTHLLWLIVATDDCLSDRKPFCWQGGNNKAFTTTRTRPGFI